MSKGGSRTDRWHYIACFFHWLAFGTMPQPVFCPGRWMARCQNGLWEHSKAHRRSELQFMMGLRIPETWNLRFHSWSIPARDNSSKGTSSQDSWVSEHLAVCEKKFPLWKEVLVLKKSLLCEKKSRLKKSSPCEKEFPARINDQPSSRREERKAAESRLSQLPSNH